MKHILMIVTLTFLTACGPEASQNSQLADANHQRNDDVKVSEVKDYARLCFIDERSGSSCPGYTQIDPIKKCDLISSSSRDTQRHYDCTNAASNEFGVQMIHPIKVFASRSGEDYFRISEYFQIKVIQAFVKTSTLDSPSFRGIGFFANEISYRLYEPRPKPGSKDVGLFIKRHKLNRQTEFVRFKDGEQARAIGFGIAAQYSHGGSSYGYGWYVRPYAKFEADGQEYRNWDNVEDDYYIDLRTKFNRRADIVQ